VTATGTVLKRSCTDVPNRLGIKSRQLEIAMKLEEIAPRDEHFISHKLYPSVDFHSGIIYKALAINTGATQHAYVPIDRRGR